jgi:uncharacterized membrane protein (UPF0127 family)
VTAGGQPGPAEPGPAQSGSAWPLIDKPAGAPAWLPDVRDPRSISRLWWVIGVVFVAGVLAVLVRGANRPADPQLATRTPLSGFGEVTVDVRSADGTETSHCLLLASTEAQRERGLMEVTDPALGGYDGMLFSFPADTDTGFWMRNTPMPLSVAYVDGSGHLVSSTAMAPCADVATCPVYPPTGTYRVAVEVPQGRLAALGLVPGATLTVGPSSCPSPG